MQKEFGFFQDEMFVWVCLGFWVCERVGDVENCFGVEGCTRSFAKNGLLATPGWLLSRGHKTDMLVV